MIEPVQGEGGFNVAPSDFLRALRRICDEHGIVLIADEVQGGIGAHRQDVLRSSIGRERRSHRVAKGLGGGFPLSGVTGRAAIMDAVASRRARRHLRRQSDRLAAGTRCSRYSRKSRSLSVVSRSANTSCSE